jgi:TRAP-type C4-dicarboxylate transport system permease large subunit
VICAISTASTRKIPNHTGDDTLGYIARVTLPYLIIMIAFVILLTLFPGIVTFMPQWLYG